MNAKTITKETLSQVNLFKIQWFSYVLYFHENHTDKTWMKIHTLLNFLLRLNFLLHKFPI